MEFSCHSHGSSAIMKPIPPELPDNGFQNFSFPVWSITGEMTVLLLFSLSAMGEVRLQGLRVGFGQGWVHVLVTAGFCPAFTQAKPVIFDHPYLNSSLGSQKILWNTSTFLTKGYFTTRYLSL